LDEGVDAAAALVADARVGHVHLTGSEATRDAVRKELDEAGKFHVRVTAELGCATPWLAAPAAWTDAELAAAATQLVAAKKANGGSNCLAPQLVVVADGWKQRGAFVDAIRAELERQPDQRAYYPGARDRRDAVLAAAGQAPLGDSDAIGLVDLGASAPAAAREAALGVEVFGPMLAVVDAPGASLDDMVAFANSEACLGSLSCTILAPEAVDAGVVDAAIADLHYGAVSVNVWSVFGYTSMANGATWGAHPTDGAEHSGHGYVGNHYGVPDIEKSVVRGGGSLAKPSVDLANRPPAIVYDALFTAIVRKAGAGGVATLLGRRLLGAIRGLLPFGSRGAPYGSVGRGN